MTGSGADPGPNSEVSAARVGAVDIGTNTVLLLVAERRGAETVALCERATITRLGQDVDRTRELSAEARERTLRCLTDYARVLRDHGVSRVVCAGTSAMRDARGGAEFAHEVGRVLGCAPRILAGSEEAEITFRGALSGLSLSGAVNVFDVGGGSTEIVRGSSDDLRIDAATSLDIGSVRLFERHVRSDPPSRDELAAVRTDIQRALSAAPAFAPSGALVGVAGTVTTIAAIALGLEPYDSARVHGMRLAASEVSRIARWLQSLPLAQRRALAGLEPQRADVIVVGAELVERIVERAGASELDVSDRGVRWGLAEAALAQPPVPGAVHRD